MNDHWLDGARRVLSPNCDERPRPLDISLIVIHCISLPPGQFDEGPVCSFFTNTLDCTEHPFFGEIEGLRVSSHLYIDRLGGIVQFVPFNQRAWHAGKSDFRGRKACNDFSIGIELAGIDHVAYTQEQYSVLIDTIHALHAHYPSTQDQPIVGHCHIAPDRKTDPGPAFNWRQLNEAGIVTF